MVVWEVGWAIGAGVGLSEGGEGRVVWEVASAMRGAGESVGGEGRVERDACWPTEGETKPFEEGEGGIGGKFAEEKGVRRWRDTLLPEGDVGGSNESTLCKGTCVRESLLRLVGESKAGFGLDLRGSETVIFSDSMVGALLFLIPPLILKEIS